MSFKCAICDFNSSRKDNLKRHILTVHSKQKNDARGNEIKVPCRRSRFLCYRSDCDNASKTYSQYCNHLTTEHQEKLTVVSLQFLNFEEFQKWKSDFEKQTCSMYVQNSAVKKLVQGVTYYYFCHRSFFKNKHPKKKTKYRQKNAGSNKLGRCCPAMIKAVVSDGKVSVEVCSVHLGHECDIGRLRLSVEDNNIIAGKLIAGVPPRRILREIREEAPPKLSRIHFAEMSDINNIKKRYRIKSSGPLRLEENDRINLETWIRDKTSQETDNPVLFYKDQNSDLQGFDRSDFILVLMTDFQKDMLMKFGDNTICIDGTHSLNEYDFQLFTLLVLDEYHEGIPVAHCFSNLASFEVYKLFFGEIRTKLNKSVKPFVFMSNGEPAFYEAWTEVMSAAQHQLMCRWHLNKTWIANLSKITKSEKRSVVLQTLNVLMMEQDVEIFEDSLHNLLNQLQSDKDTVMFYHYFNNNFTSNVQIWAQCHRPFVPIHTNMGLEALHKNIKFNYLDGLRCVKLDKTIYALMCLSRDKKFERMIKLAKQKPSKKLLRIKKSHEKSLECGEVEELGGDKWMVHSSVDSSKKYQVKLVKYEPCCIHVCKECKICLHMVTCSCPDNVIKQNICEHIHAVMRSHTVAMVHDFDHVPEKKIEMDVVDDVDAALLVKEEYEDVPADPLMILSENEVEICTAEDDDDDDDDVMVSSDADLEDEADRKKLVTDELLMLCGAINNRSAPLTKEMCSEVLKYIRRANAVMKFNV
ncbi:uncharacterized protein LOC135843672 [Planococcus citri]|uniref:uncharacterized protein LOC135843672 n=1 Tax=Planococcus citri TaxID=170843 RepID=UPI0031F75331